MKTYGLIVADNGSDMYITGTSDPRWEGQMDNVITAVPHAPREHFEVVQLGWHDRPAASARHRRRRPAERLGDALRPRSEQPAPATTARAAIRMATACPTPWS